MDAVHPLNVKFENARVDFDGKRLTVSTGEVSRVWRWERSWITEEIADRAGGCWRSRMGTADWELPEGLSDAGARLLSLTAGEGDDEGFTSPHLWVESRVEYPAANLELKFSLWIYPDAPGLRQQLFLKKLRDEEFAAPGMRRQGQPREARVERLPGRGEGSLRRYFGYHNDTQLRNDTYLDILKEEVRRAPLLDREWCEWASVACMEDGAGGLALVKESHKCVDNPGLATGAFYCDAEAGLCATGWGMWLAELSPERFTSGWAHWLVCWRGGDFEREQAIKSFDQLRYPFDPARDIYIQANTWGSTDTGREARLAATEAPVLRELESCAELGIDILQIDDGWQVPPGHPTWKPEENGWKPHPDSYPQGWGPVRARAEALGVKLGLWAAALPIQLEELQTAREEGGFAQFKLDFAVFKNREPLDGLMDKVRAFIAWSGQRVRVNWDVTEEHTTRYGYFFAREYGSIYLENRKPAFPQSVVYRPHTVLRDLWQVSKYLNLHRFQASIQNVDMVDPERSDACRHSHAYCTAIALMGIPLFFQQTQLLTPAARLEIRALLDVYKKNRGEMFRGMVFPIGDKPDNASWTGFHCRLPDGGRGYLTVFRERCNPEPARVLCLAGLADHELILTDLQRGGSRWLRTGPRGEIEFQIERPADFLFLSYQCADGSGA